MLDGVERALKLTGRGAVDYSVCTVRSRPWAGPVPLNDC